MRLGALKAICIFAARFLLGMNNRKKTVYITRKAHFNAAHRLYNPQWTDQENEDFFGKCANKYFHGHNFDLHVTVKGSADDTTGMVLDLKHLKHVIQEHVVEKLDHRNINEEVEFMQGKMASIENLVVEIWNQLEPHIAKGQLHEVKLYETPNQYVTYFGE
jgi:6-pyruvoyltetrahydropterin/6-carboxytetrahydropterin synthase